jgi:hypothetical protein
VQALPAAAADLPASIYDRAGLEAIAKNPEGDYVLMADIDLSASPWKPIPFKGTLEGNGHTIYNVTVNQIEDAAPLVAHNANDRAYWNSYFTGFFSRLSGAKVSNLNILGANVHIETTHTVSVGILAGYADNAEIIDCNIQGRAYLESTKILLGIGGVVGYGNANISGCTTDTELVFVTDWRNYPNFCEEYMGGLIANGSGNLSNNHVKLRGWATIHGFAHNGGLVGLFREHNEKRRSRNRYVIENNEIDAEFHFFEHTRGRHAYCKLLWGEKNQAQMTEKNNKELNFVKDESFDYKAVLLPEKCAAPVYITTKKELTAAAFGYSEHVCTTCAYTYRDSYISPEKYMTELESRPESKPELKPESSAAESTANSAKSQALSFYGVTIPMSTQALVIYGLAAFVVVVLIVILLCAVKGRKRD